MTAARSDIHYEIPSGFNVRDATLADVDALTNLWYTSFNTSHNFWDTMTPDDKATRQWWNDTWTMGIKAGPDVLRTFVVEDLANEGKLVAFARWNVPQEDGRQDIPLPPYLTHWDEELVEAFWEGMPRNRRAVMGNSTHWMLEFLGVDQHYQRHGLGFALVKWGCQQADAAGLEVYLDATIKGLPFYRRHFGFQDRMKLPIPPRAAQFGTYELVAVVRQPNPEAATLSPALLSTRDEIAVVASMPSSSTLKKMPETHVVEILQL